MKQIVSRTSTEEHRAIKSVADKHKRTIGQHALHIVLQDAEVSSALADLLRRKQPAAKNPGRKA